MSRIQREKTGVQYLTVTADQAARRIDNYLLGHFAGLPKARVYQMLRRGEVRVNSGRIRQHYRLQTGDLVRLPPVRQNNSQNNSQDNSQNNNQKNSQDAGKAAAQPPAYLLARMRGSSIFEDDELIVLNKPAGIVVHGGSGRSFGVIELLRLLRPQEDALHLVHRLDRESSGCLLIARNMRSLRRLHSALKAGSISREYQALLAGRLRGDAFVVDLPLRKNVLVSGERMVAVAASGEPGRQARTYFKVLQRFKDCTLVQARIETGRTHQIRVHASSLGHPILGDDKYGDKARNQALKKRGLRRLFLHASRLELPAEHGKRRFEAALPEALQGFIKTCL